MRVSMLRLSAVAILGLAAAGCKSSGSSDMPMKGDMSTVMMAEGKDMMMAAPMDDTYMLTSPAGGRPMLSVPLKKGDMMGFKMVDGKMMAMAGGMSYDVTGMKGAMWVHGMQK